MEAWTGSSGIARWK